MQVTSTHRSIDASYGDGFAYSYEQSSDQVGTFKESVSGTFFDGNSSSAQQDTTITVTATHLDITGTAQGQAIRPSSQGSGMWNAAHCSLNVGFTVSTHATYSISKITLNAEGTGVDMSFQFKEAGENGRVINPGTFGSGALSAGTSYIFSLQGSIGFAVFEATQALVEWGIHLQVTEAS